MQKAKEKLAEKNRRDKERLQQLEKKKEQERLEKKRYANMCKQTVSHAYTVYFGFDGFSENYLRNVNCLKKV